MTPDARPLTAEEEAELRHALVLPFGNEGPATLTIRRLLATLDEARALPSTPTRCAHPDEQKEYVPVGAFQSSCRECGHVALHPSIGGALPSTPTDPHGEDILDGLVVGPDPVYWGGYRDGKAASTPTDREALCPECDHPLVEHATPGGECVHAFCTHDESFEIVRAALAATPAEPAGLDVVQTFLSLHDEDDGAGWPCDGKCASVRALRARLGEPR